MSSDPRWRFRSLRPIAAETQRRLRATRSYGEARLQPLPIRRTGGDLRIGDDIFRQADERVSLPGSTLRLLQPAGPARASAGATAPLVFLVLLIPVVAAIVLLPPLRRRHPLPAAAPPAR